MKGKQKEEITRNELGAWCYSRDDRASDGEGNWKDWKVNFSLRCKHGFYAQLMASARRMNEVTIFVVEWSE